MITRITTQVFLVLVILASSFTSLAGSKRIHEVYFRGTDQELHVYKIFGEESGPTVLIMGGIQNEPGGYLTADKYVDYSLKRGNLIVIPRANLLTIHRDLRGIYGDMNRKFADIKPNDRDKEIVEVIKKHIEKSDVLLNLHDGWGFYRTKYIDSLHQPKLWGQAIIADTERIFSKKHKKEFNLREIAERVVAHVNAEFPEKKYDGYKIRFKNTRTSAGDSAHKEQRRSATYYAMTRSNIPAFGVETSKNIPHELRVKYQTAMINAFLDDFGVIPFYPGVEVETPQLNFILVRVNGKAPVAVKNGETLTVEKGDEIIIEDAHANYRRGLIVDLKGQGGFNDLQKPFTITKPTKIKVKKDKFPCGEVKVAVVDKPSVKSFVAKKSEPEPKRKPKIAKSGPPEIKSFIIGRNGNRVKIPAGTRFNIVEGDKIVLLDLEMKEGDSKALAMNFKGFVPSSSKKNNKGEDRGHLIDTSTQLISRLAKKIGDSLVYEVVAEKGKEKIAKIELKIDRPHLRYLYVWQDGRRVAYKNKEVISARRGSKIKILDVDLNVSELDDVRVNFKGFKPEAVKNLGEDRGYDILLDPKVLLSGFSLDGKGKEFEIIITKNSRQIGRNVIKLVD
ncbi:M14/M99 family metallopeptidase [Bdellovibrionota bacterium]